MKSKNSFSNTDSTLRTKAPYTTLSIFEGIPKYGTPPFSLGIATHLKGLSLYFCETN